MENSDVEKTESAEFEVGNILGGLSAIVLIVGGIAWLASKFGGAE